jgi:hypothetical protein
VIRRVLSISGLIGKGDCSKRVANYFLRKQPNQPCSTGPFGKRPSLAPLRHPLTAGIISIESSISFPDQDKDPSINRIARDYFLGLLSFSFGDSSLCLTAL